MLSCHRSHADASGWLDDHRRPSPCTERSLPSRGPFPRFDAGAAGRTNLKMRSSFALPDDYPVPRRCDARMPVELLDLRVQKSIGILAYMENDHNTFVRRFVKAFNKKDSAALAPFLHPDVVFLAHGDDDVRGLDAVLALRDGVFDNFETNRFETGDVLAASPSSTIPLGS
jgi:hypothetical protein